MFRSTWPQPDPVGPGQESVWDYPRPPRLEATKRRIRVELADSTIADSTRALRVLETSHPPTYYVHPDDVRWDHLEPAPGVSICEWKGQASYWTVRVGGEERPAAAWSYRDPDPSFATIVDHVAFYPALVDCFVDDELARPQPGRFYGGWVTSDLVGPFKGAPGSMGW